VAAPMRGTFLENDVLMPLAPGVDLGGPLRQTGLVLPPTMTARMRVC
jgi:hypothetical protein